MNLARADNRYFVENNTTGKIYDYLCRREMVELI